MSMRTSKKKSSKIFTSYVHAINTFLYFILQFFADAFVSCEEKEHPRKVKANGLKSNRIEI